MYKIGRMITLALFGLSNSTSAQPGSLDNSFNPQTATGSFVKACALQSDGKIIVGGDFAKGILRLNADGSSDLSFNAGSGADDAVSAIALQSDGKILIGGDFNTYNGTVSNKIARLNADGSLDNSFTSGTGFSGSNCSFNSPAKVNVLQLQSDGKILAGGCFSLYSGTGTGNLVRLNSNGTLDNTFITGTEPNERVFSITLQNDGKLILGGRFFYAPDGFIHGFLARLNSNGSLDSAFSKNISIGPTNVSEIYATAVQNDGKIIAGGNFNYCNGVTPTKRICRFNADGTLDNTFLLNQISPLLYYAVNSLLIQNDGKIIAGGKATLLFQDTLARIVRLNTNGTVDNTFVKGSGVNGGDVYTTALQNDGKIIIGGNFTAYDGTIRNGIARLNAENFTGMISQKHNAESIRIVPNPNAGIFSIRWNEEMQDATISITDILGKKVYHSKMRSPYQNPDIDISSEADGLYSVLIENKGKPYRYKILVSRSR